MTRTRYLLLLLALLAVPASSCRSTGEECDTCSSDDECKAGLSCSSFSDGSKRCASGLGATTCSTP
jgi:hypothetical protein